MRRFRTVGTRTLPRHAPVPEVGEVAWSTGLVVSIGSTGAAPAMSTAAGRPAGLAARPGSNGTTCPRWSCRPAAGCCCASSCRVPGDRGQARVWLMRRSGWLAGRRRAGRRRSPDRLAGMAGPVAAGRRRLVTRLLTAAHRPTESDSVQLTLGVDGFDVRLETPHAPGYWLYVAAGRVLRALGPLDATGSLLFRYGPETSDSGTTGRARHLQR
jgi:hypothetical protein